MAKKFEFINNPEWNDCKTFKGVKTGLTHLYTFEAEKNGKMYFTTSMESYGSPEECANSNYMKYYLESSGAKLTGRVVFLGYFTEQYAPEYGVTYLIEA